MKAQRGSSGIALTLSLTLALDEGGGQLHAPAALPPEKKTRYPMYRRPVGPQGRSGRLRKISPPPGFDPRTIQPVASRYTDYAIPAPRIPVPSLIEICSATKMKHEDGRRRRSHNSTLLNS
jgi:hypothetical protein